ncbi:O-antigen ligase family protein [Streptomyces sp. NPDC001970]
MNAPITVLIFLLGVFALPCAVLDGTGDRVWKLEPLNPVRARIPLPLWGFAACASVSAIQQWTEVAAQNAMVYVSFVALTALAAAWTSAGSPMMLLQWVRATAVMGAVVYVVAVGLSGPGSSGLYNARVYGEVAWIGMVAAVPLGRRSRLGYAVPLLLLAATVLSLSRTATAVSALLFLALALTGRDRGKLRRFFLFTTAMICSAYWLINRYQPLRGRFTENDNQMIAGWEVGTSGRARLWSITWDSIQESPWSGHGVGSAMRLISDVFGADYLSHPHNDYLRLWHDLGLIGLGLWLSTMLIIGHGAYRRWRAAPNDADRAIHQAALLAVIGLSLNAVTSNLLTYIFVMVPIAVIIGTSLGRANANGRQDTSLLAVGDVEPGATARFADVRMKAFVAKQGDDTTGTADESSKYRERVRAASTMEA